MEQLGIQKIVEEKEAILSLIANTLENGGAFTLWRKPNSIEKVLLVCNSGTTELDEISFEDLKSGFVFAPFLPNQKKVFFSADVVYRFVNGELQETKNGESFASKTIDAEAAYKPLKFYSTATPSRLSPSYQQLVEMAVQKIEAGAFEKIVLSRFREITLPEKFDLLEAFNTLCEKHPQAMVSLVSSQATGTWLGATPELLVSVNNQSKFKTHALAGTLPYSPSIDLKSVAWTQKEIEEQALVSRYIINCFKKIRVREYIEQGPKTVVAGNVMHLKTDYEVDMNEINFPQLGSVMLKLLHPTSAVCGMPLEPALDFLKNNEGYDREFYSGYLGPINFDNESEVFVNLRCLQLLEEKVRLYAGAGVTADSNPEKEMAETEIKMRNLLSVIK
jgi:isochorismate synthase